MEGQKFIKDIKHPPKCVNADLINNREIILVVQRAIIHPAGYGSNLGLRKATFKRHTTILGSGFNLPGVEFRIRILSEIIYAILTVMAIRIYTIRFHDRQYVG